MNTATSNVYLTLSLTFETEVKKQQQQVIHVCITAKL